MLVNSPLGITRLLVTRIFPLGEYSLTRVLACSHARILALEETLVCSFTRLLVCSFASLLICSFARLLVYSLTGLLVTGTSPLEVHLFCSFAYCEPRSRQMTLYSGHSALCNSQYAYDSPFDSPSIPKSPSVLESGSSS
jgi:hypothetical protein